tara:strand:- start:1048 stop:5130 length:4083 start_codon:yes stop_codon:yes gene_type:complete
MDTTSHIRVGDPQIYSSEVQVFVSGDSAAEVIEKVHIVEHDSVSCITSKDHIKLVIPDGIGLTWSDSITVNPGGVYFVDNGQNAEDKLKPDSSRFEIDNPKKVLTIFIDEDFQPGDTLIIGGLKVDVGQNDDTSGTNHFGLEVNGQDTSEIEYTDIEALVIARPFLVFTEEIGLVVNDPPTGLAGLELREHSQYGTIKKDQRITIRLPDSPDDLRWLDDSTSWAGLENALVYRDSTSVESDGKVLIIVPKINFSVGQQLDLGGVKIDTVSTRIMDGDKLYFKIRNRPSTELLSENAANVEKSYWVSEPQVSSLTEQLYYIRRIGEELSPFPMASVIIKDDNINPVFETYRDSLQIRIPSNAKWDVNDDYLSQLGSAAGSISSIVTFSPDSLTVTVYFLQGFEANDSLIIHGLSVLPEFPSEESQNFLFSLNGGQSQNIVDEKYFYVGEVDFTSLDENIILKGNTTDGNLSNIRIEEKSIIPRLNQLVLYLPPELSIVWSEDIEVSFEGTQQNVLAKIDAENVSLDPESDLKLLIPLIGQNLIEEGDIIFINNLTYQNQSNLNQLSRSAYLGLEIAEGIFIPDSLPSYLASSLFKSVDENRIIYNGIITGFPLNDILMSNDSLLYYDYGIEIIGLGDTISVEVPYEFQIFWSDAVLAELSIEGTDGTEWVGDGINLSLAEGNTEFLLVFESPLEGEVLTLSNLKVDVSDSLGLGFIRLKKTANEEYLGQDDYPIMVGNPDILLSQENNIIWVNSLREKTLPDVHISESDSMPFLTDGFSLVIYDNHDATVSEFLEFDSSRTNSIEFSDMISSTVSFDSELRIISFSGLSDFIQDELVIRNIPITFSEEVYSVENAEVLDDRSQSLRLSISEYGYQYNFVESNDINIKPSLFFHPPLLYSQNQTVNLGFYHKENFISDNYPEPPSMIDNVVLDLGVDTIYVNSASANTDYIPSLELGGNVYNNLINIIVSLEPQEVQRINLALDKLSFIENNVRLIAENPLETVDEDTVAVLLFPGVSPDNFIWGNRRLNTDSTILNIYSNADLMEFGLPTVKVTSYSDSSETTIQDTGTIMVMPNGNELYLHLNELFEDKSDGIFEVSLVINANSDSTSFPFQRFYLLDRTAPEIVRVFPEPGQKWDGSGQDISIHDSLDLTLVDDLLFFSSDGVISEDLDTLDIDLTYVFDNVDLVNVEIIFDGGVIGSIHDSLSINDNLEGYYIVSNNFIESDLVNKSGDLLYTITLTDKAGNQSKVDLLYYLINNLKSATEHFFNYPNPFSTRNGEITRYRYTLPNELSSARLLIFDNNGDLVYLYKLRSDELTAGTHVIAWEGESIYGQKLATGVYFALIEYNNGKRTRIVKTAIVN